MNTIMKRGPMHMTTKKARRTTAMPSIIVVLGALLSACDGQPANEADGRTVTDPKPVAVEVTAPAPSARSTGRLRLAGPIDDASVDVALAMMAGISTNAVETRAQSFRIMQDGRQVAAMITGQADSDALADEGTAENICFASTVVEGRGSLVSTVGTGQWETEECDSTKAVALLDDGTIAMLVEGSNRNTTVLEPIVLRWNRKTNGLRVDEAWTRSASNAGAATIAEIEKSRP